MGKLRKLPFALAFALAMILLAGRLSPTSFWDGLSGFSQQTQLLGGACSSVFTAGQGQARLFEWIGLSMVGILVGLAWAAIGQALSGTFGSPKYNQFIKGMIWSGVETAALLGILSGIFFLDLWNYGNERIEAARAYATITKNTAMFDFTMMLGANMVAGFVTNMNPYFKLPGKVFMSVGFQMAPMFKPIIDILGIAMQLITTAIVMWSAQEFLLCFVQNYMFVILLPAGFFLRGFGLNAGGNALIAIALAMFFIYPQMVVMLGEVVAIQMEGELDQSGQYPHFLTQSTCIDKPICCLQDVKAIDGELSIPNGDPKNGYLSVKRINSGTFNTGTAPGGPNYCIYNTVLANAYKATVGLISGTGLLAFAGGAVAIGALFKYINISWMSVAVMGPLFAFSTYAIIEMVFFVFILTMLAPIFIIFVTLTIAKEIAKVLGTEMDLSALEKLI